MNNWVFNIRDTPQLCFAQHIVLILFSARTASTPKATVVGKQKENYKMVVLQIQKSVCWDGSCEAVFVVLWFCAVGCFSLCFRVVVCGVCLEFFILYSKTRYSVRNQELILGPSKC